jgi:hypothetical protein
MPVTGRDLGRADHMFMNVEAIHKQSSAGPQPAFLISNDFSSPVELLVSDYARRWRVENVISEAVKFFHLNALSSPILVKVHFDILLTMMAQKLRGFEQCDALKIYRHFVRGKATVAIQDGSVRVTLPRKAQNPILRNVP